MTSKRHLAPVLPDGGSWTVQVSYMNLGQSWSPLRWCRLQRIAFRVDAGHVTLCADPDDPELHLFLDGRRCRLMEEALKETNYRVYPAVRGTLEPGLRRPVRSWEYLFEKKIRGAIPRWSTIWPLPWRRLNRHLLNDADPKIAADALEAFALPRKWQRLGRRMEQMDDEGAWVRVVDERIYVVEGGRERRDRVLEDALKACTVQQDFVIPPDDDRQGNPLAWRPAP